MWIPFFRVTKWIQMLFYCRWDPNLRSPVDVDATLNVFFSNSHCLLPSPVLKILNTAEQGPKKVFLYPTYPTSTFFFEGVENDRGKGFYLTVSHYNPLKGSKESHRSHIFQTTASPRQPCLFLDCWGRDYLPWICHTYPMISTFISSISHTSLVPCGGFLWGLPLNPPFQIMFTSTRWCPPQL